MHIVQIGPELAPIAKVGGLGDVVYGLSKALIHEKHSVEIILPKYAMINLSSPMVRVKKTFTAGHLFITHISYENLSITLLDSDKLKKFFSRDLIYGYPDDIERFLEFCESVIFYLSHSQKKPDIIHIHDWASAAIAPLWKLQSSDKKPAIFLNIHNLEYQGKCPQKELSNPLLQKIAPCIQDPHDPKYINLLLSGIEFADEVVTVSPSYEKEIMTLQGGYGLQNELLKYSHKVHGILNGIDLEYWNPAKDPYLKAHYHTHPPFTPQKLEKIKQAKLENRKELSKLMGLSEKNAPLVSCITRIVWQKGPRLIRHAMFRAIEKKGQFILLGSTHSPDLKKEFEALRNEVKNYPDVAILLDKQDHIANLIYASSDMLIIPSIFEPCGLTQMIAMRYGTIPVARRTGGLQDTVFDIDMESAPESKRNGFTFDHPDPQGVDWALDRAIDAWYNRREKWEALMQNGMSTDFSWVKAVKHYLDLYSKAIIV